MKIEKDIISEILKLKNEKGIQNILDTIVLYCELNELDEVEIGEEISKNKALVKLLEKEAMDRNLIKLPKYYKKSNSENLEDF